MDSGCVSYREKIAALVIGDLPGAERRELEAHLDVCPQCRMERESFARTVQMLASAEDEPAPRHFFISPEPQPVSPWRIFTQLPSGRRAAFAGAFVLAILLCGAALSQFHARLDTEGWSVGFGRGDLDTAALREGLMKTAAEESQNNRRQLMEEFRNEIALMKEDEGRRTRQMEEILARLDSRIDGRVERSEEQIRYDTQIMVAVLYQELARQWAAELEAVKFRQDITDMRDYVKTQKTEEILGVLLQSAYMKSY
jgi:hypothetical protein